MPALFCRTDPPAAQQQPWCIAGGLRWDAPNGRKGSSDKGGKYGCGTVDQHYEYTAGVAEYLSNSPHWKRHSGRNFLLLNSFYLVGEVLGQKLYEKLLSAPAIFTSSDSTFKYLQELNRAGPMTIVPYKTDFRLDDFAWQAKADEMRNSTVMFHGSVMRGSNSSLGAKVHWYRDGGLRKEMCDKLGAFERSNMRCADMWKEQATLLDHSRSGKVAQRPSVLLDADGGRARRRQARRMAASRHKNAGTGDLSDSDRAPHPSVRPDVRLDAVQPKKQSTQS